MKIGLLEDNPAVSDYLTVLLELEGHTVEGHTHGSCLLETLFPETEVRFPLPYDLILVDLVLPGKLSGLETIQAIQVRLSPAQLPLLIVTAVGPEILEEITMKLPTMPVLRKPFRRSDLLQMIEDLTSRHDPKDR